MTPDNPLSEIPLFSRLDPDDRDALLASMTRTTLKAEEPVFWIGDPGDTLYVVVEGRVEITAPDERGNHLMLDTLGPGGVFGEISLLDGGPRSATVRAITDVTLLALTRDAFHAVLREHPSVAIGALHIMGARQRTSTAVLRGLTNPNAAIGENTTTWQRVSDRIAAIAASHAFTLTHVAWFGGWILLNVLAPAGWLPRVLGFDPFPFGLLTLIVSLEAIFLSIFVLVSQNRQSERERIRTDFDHQVNVKAHLAIVNVIERLDRIERAVGGKSLRPVTKE
jgi:CRP/FNR family cyclic AMP-dependent transcriptional regulator